MSASPVAVNPQWLALRGPVDSRARSTSGASLADDLARFLRRRTAGSARPAALIDVGAGTGSGAAWLRPRLPVAQDWRLLDVDAALLSIAAPIRQGWARPAVADLAGLPGILVAEPVDAVTGQALLDLLTARQIRAMLTPAVRGESAVLFSLSVTGRVTLAPAHPDDGLVNNAFNAHQHRSGRLGPDAAACAVDMLRSQGYLVTVANTPWRLDGTCRELAVAWLQGRALAAAEQAPAHVDRIGRWLADRVAAARRGEITATVGHVDLLGLPPRR